MAWTAPPNVPVTRKEAVLRQLREEILTSRLRPGTVLKDAEEAARLGVSITPVREAIAQLAAEGLVDIAPNRTRQVTRVTQKNALELIDIMSVLTTAAFEWAAGNLSENHLTRLREHYQAFADGVRDGDVPAASVAGTQFSTTITMACGNRELQLHVDLVVARLLRLLALTAESVVWPVWLEGYRETLEYLEAGDHPAALDRYRQIYTGYREVVARMAFD
jgi:DNA-binding GntR family transcriptional regulator